MKDKAKKVKTTETDATSAAVVESGSNGGLIVKSDIKTMKMYIIQKEKVSVLCVL